MKIDEHLRTSIFQKLFRIVVGVFGEVWGIKKRDFGRILKQMSDILEVIFLAQIVGCPLISYNPRFRLIRRVFSGIYSGYIVFFPPLSIHAAGGIGIRR